MATTADRMMVILWPTVRYMVIVIGVIWLAYTSAQDRPELSTSPSRAVVRSGILAKTVENTKLRLIAIVGLEGTGHHYVKGTINQVFSTPLDKENHSIGCRIGKLLYVPTLLSTPSSFAKAQSDLREQVHKLVEIEERMESSNSSISMVNGCRMLSYPMGGGKDKVFRYVDLQMVAEVAEKEHIDFRVIYLQRSARQLLVSNVLHSGYHEHLGGDSSDSSAENFMRYVEIILADLSIMQSMLAEISQDFVVCHQYDLMKSREQAREIASFVSPSIARAKDLEEALIDSAKEHDGPIDQLPFPNAEIVIERLQKKLDVTDAKYCVH